MGETSPAISNAGFYTWQDGSTEKTYTVKQTGLYILTAENICGKTKDSIVVSAGICDIFMPSAFTPNRDGVNDIFRVRYPFPVSSFRMEVYNRWGQRVFETENITNGWDGTISGQDEPAGAYVWFINVQYDNGKRENLKGSVMLIR